MTSKYVDANALIKWIDNLLVHKDKMPEGERETLLTAKWHIEKMPSEDVAPVRRGRWLNTSIVELSAKCSECGCEIETWPAEHDPKYCAECGAVMEE